jgi:hypothetical protein
MNRKDKFERILLFFTVEQANRYLLDFERNELNRLERGGSRERSETSAFRDPAFSFSARPSSQTTSCSCLGSIYK